MPKRSREEEGEEGPFPKSAKEAPLDLSMVPPEILFKILQNTDAKTVRTLGLYVPEIRESLKYAGFRKSLCESLKHKFSQFSDEKITTKKKVDILLALAQEYGKIHFFIKHQLRTMPMSINCITFNGEDSYDFYTVTTFIEEGDKYTIVMYDSWHNTYREAVSTAQVRKYYTDLLNMGDYKLGFKMYISDSRHMKEVTDGGDSLVIRKDKDFPRRLPLYDDGQGVYRIHARSIKLSDDLSYKFNAMCMKYNEPE